MACKCCTGTCCVGEDCFETTASQCAELNGKFTFGVSCESDCPCPPQPPEGVSLPCDLKWADEQPLHCAPFVFGASREIDILAVRQGGIVRRVEGFGGSGVGDLAECSPYYGQLVFSNPNFPEPDANIVGAHDRSQYLMGVALGNPQLGTDPNLTYSPAATIGIVIPANYLTPGNKYSRCSIPLTLVIDEIRLLHYNLRPQLYGLDREPLTKYRCRRYRRRARVFTPWGEDVTGEAAGGNNLFFDGCTDENGIATGTIDCSECTDLPSIEPLGSFLQDPVWDCANPLP